MTGDGERNPFAAPGVPSEGGDRHYGDKAGEHLRIQRGRYEAWFHVVCGFFIVAGAIWMVLTFGVGGTVEFGLKSTFPDRHERDRIVMWIAGISGAVALLAAAWIFHDRWRCIEARASRYCSGLMNVSLIYVPLVAAGYALVRGVRKLSGR